MAGQPWSSLVDDARSQNSERVRILVRSREPLTREQQIVVTKQALKQRFATRLPAYEPQKRDILLTTLATELVDRTQACAKQHLLRDLDNAMVLTGATEAECRALEDAASKLFEIRVVAPKTFGQKAYEAIKHTAGVVWWKIVVDGMGLDTDKDEGPSGSAGVRG